MRQGSGTPEAAAEALGRAIANQGWAHQGCANQGLGRDEPSLTPETAGETARRGQNFSTREAAHTQGPMRPLSSSIDRSRLGAVADHALHLAPPTVERGEVDHDGSAVPALEPLEHGERAHLDRHREQATE